MNRNLLKIALGLTLIGPAPALATMADEYTQGIMEINPTTNQILTLCAPQGGRSGGRLNPKCMPVLVYLYESEAANPTVAPICMHGASADQTRIYTLFMDSAVIPLLNVLPATTAMGFAFSRAFPCSERKD